MRELIMVRYGEIYLKGQNRPYFMRLLVRRVTEAAQPFGAKVWLHDSRLFVADISDTLACMDRIRKVFGVHSVCPAIEMDKGNFDAVMRKAAELMQGKTGTFKVLARRADKNYPMDSPEINAHIGAYVLDRVPGLTVDVKNPEHVLSVEIRDWAYLYATVLPGVGGMPVGSNGKAALLLSGGIDSPVAGYLIAKRGVELVAVHFHSFPYTGERAKDKVITLAKILSGYACGIKAFVVPFTEIQMAIHEKCLPDHTTLIMRRFMMRIADRIAENEGAQALITGESIGQVASQTMEALVCTDQTATRPVFRPLIGFDKAEITQWAERIGTYETSCLPYEDCCTVFTPRHPVTHPRLDRVIKAESVLEDADGMIDRAIAGVEIVNV